MGQVFRATDTKLGREVALKVLPADMASDPERLARFQREARAVAALNHPHIVTLFSVEEAEGVYFLTMELLEGKSLDRHIPADGLPVDQIVEIASALAEALAVAHEKSIVHRDLKPANVMVTADGRIKVLDFGLSKDIRTDNLADATLTSAGHTQAGVVMGTPAYMSPEQLAGRPIDHRTDIFSLGVVLHEMATGRRPFEGNSSAEAGLLHSSRYATASHQRAVGLAERSGADHPALPGERSAPPRADGARYQQRISGSGTAQFTRLGRHHKFRLALRARGGLGVCPRRGRILGGRAAV